MEASRFRSGPQLEKLCCGMKNLEQVLDSQKHKRLLVIFPHPDDESVMAGGLIKRSLNKGYGVRVVSLTRGERGRIHNNGRGKSVRQIRSGEFVKAMQNLGVTNYSLYDIADASLKNSTNWQIIVERELREFDPGIVVSYDRTGITGHPDHIALGRFIFNYLKDVKVKILLFWPAPVYQWMRVHTHVDLRPNLPVAEFFLQLDAKERLAKMRAISAYRSQFPLKKMFVFLLALLGWGKEGYALADYTMKYRYKYVEFEI